MRVEVTWTLCTEHVGTLDQMVLDGELAYDPETGEYTNLMGGASDE
jgi:hypothetical protein